MPKKIEDVDGVSHHEILIETHQMDIEIATEDGADSFRLKVEVWKKSNGELIGKSYYNDRPWPAVPTTHGATNEDVVRSAINWAKDTIPPDYFNAD